MPIIYKMLLHGCYMYSKHSAFYVVNRSSDRSHMILYNLVIGSNKESFFFPFHRTKVKTKNAMRAILGLIFCLKCSNIYIYILPLKRQVDARKNI